jgi:hypothetical protein
MIAPSVMNLTAVPAFSADDLGLSAILVTPRRLDRRRVVADRIVGLRSWKTRIR